MTKEERMFILEVLNKKLDTIIQLLENKNKRCDQPLIRFSKANPNVDDRQLKSYEMGLFQMLDKK